jgi:hypothetical protein
MLPLGDLRPPREDLLRVRLPVALQSQGPEKVCGMAINPIAFARAVNEK